MIQCPNCKTKLEFEGSTAIRARNRRANIPTIIKRICNVCKEDFETMEVIRKEYEELKKLEEFFNGVENDIHSLLKKIIDYRKEL